MWKRLICASIISVGLIGFGCFRAYYTQNASNLVTVKGLSEKVVRSDIAEMSIKFHNKRFESLEELNTKRMADKEKVLSFLKKHGVTDEEIVNFTANTSDYIEKTKEKADSEVLVTKNTRYFDSEDRFNIKTKHLEKVDIIKADVMKLFSENVFVTYDYNYKLTNFINIKLEMMKEASANARKNAEVFVEPQGVAIGDVVYLNQGEVTIRAEDESEDVNYWESKKDKSVNKKLRLVVRAGFSQKKL